MKTKFPLGGLALASLLGSTLLSACGGGTKSGSNIGNTPIPNPGSGYYLKVSMNGGAPVDFSKAASADILGDLSNPNKVEFSGLPANAVNNFPAFSLYIWVRDKKIQGGQTYQPDDANIGATYNLDGFDRYESVHMDTLDFVLKIDTLTKTEMSGSFWGSMERTTNGEIMKVAGTFKLPVKD